MSDWLSERQWMARHFAHITKRKQRNEKQPASHSLAVNETLADSMEKTTEEGQTERSMSENSSAATTPWSVLGESCAGSLEPIAIIGMGCRLPGSAQDPAGLWDMLTSKRTAWTPGPGKRFNMEAFHDPTGRLGGTTNTGGGHFLKDDVAAFDASFFGISPVEAMAMDPQHRLLLEIAYESFENAGLSTESLWGSNMGVYVGQWSTDYHEMLARDIDAPPLYHATGTGPAISSNRLSYFFNLRGPSFTVDTGCSSSLVALHQAVQSLRTAETTQCFVGGVNLLLDPQRFAYQSKLKFFSKEGRSFAFDDRANGYGRGEGCAGVVLKPLSAALRDGNHIRAVIRNTVLNQDGRTPGLTVPSKAAQKEAIFKAYTQVGLELRADYVEAHGTGTIVGDPIEASAIAEALAQGRQPDSPLPIGSIKGNIGHTEALAGLAGLVKAVLMLEHGMIPPQANYENGNPDILLDQWNLRIPRQLERQNLRRISINSFGYGGTNAHLILDAASDIISKFSQSICYGMPPETLPLAAESHRVFFISAASEASARKICIRLAKYLVMKHGRAEEPNLILARLAHTLSKQSVHAHRLTVVARNMTDLVTKLSAAALSPIPRQEKSGSIRIAFVFGGQGAQYAEMGHGLLKSHRRFLESLHRAQRHLAQLGCCWDLVDEICRPKEESRVNEPEFSQPLSTAIQLALVDLLGYHGVYPCAVLGHSSGEIAASYASGVISFEQAMSVAYFRGKVVADMIANNGDCNGSMLAVGASPEDAQTHIDKISESNGRVRIACFNSPKSVTISGDSAAIDELLDLLNQQGIFNRKLKTSGAAYHSHQMKLVEHAYAERLKDVLTPSVTEDDSSSAPRFFSSVAGKDLNDTSSGSSEYWVNNLLSPVHFAQSLKLMCEEKFMDQNLDMILEVGPHSQLKGPILECLRQLPKSSPKISCVSTLRRNTNAELAFLECLGSIHVESVSLRLENLNRSGNEIAGKTSQLSMLVDLPPYPFDKKSTYWHETRISREFRHRQHLPHELLGTLSQDANRLEPRWRRLLNLKELPWLRGHIVQGQIVFPAAGFLTMAVQAMRQHWLAVAPNAQVQSIEFRNVSISRALILPENGPDVEITLSLRPETRTARESSNTWNEFRIFTVSAENAWTEHARGLISADTEEINVGEVIPNLNDLCRIDAECTNHRNPQKLYYMSQKIGLDWRDAFNNVVDFRTGPNTAATTTLAPALGTNSQAVGGMGDILHASMLDSSLFHGYVGSLIMERDVKSTVVPHFIKRMWISTRLTTPHRELKSKCAIGQSQLAYDVMVQSPNEDVLLAAHDIRFARLPGASEQVETTVNLCHGLDWVTYVDEWNSKHRDQICKSVVPTGNCLEGNKYLDALSYYYVREAIKKTSLVDIHVAHRRRYLEWMEWLAAGSELGSHPPPPKPKDTAVGALGEAVLRLGPHLPAILKHEIDPLELLTPDGLLTKIYQADCFSRCTAQIAEYCYHLGRQNPGLKILEVGGGTASATIPILQSMNRDGGHCVGAWHFTDISPGFFPSAKERLGKLADIVEFRVLNIEQRGQEQGFQEDEYDLIVASNVIHAVPHIDPVLDNLFSLLKPGGRLIQMEITKPTPYHGLVFGVFEGWWAGYDEGRRMSPLIRKHDWIAKYERTGFSDSGAFFEDYSESDGGTMTGFVARKPMDESMEKSDEHLPVHIVTTDDAVSAVETESKCIQEAFPNIKVTVKGLSMPSPGNNIVVMLPEVSRLLCDGLDNSSWGSFKSWLLTARSALLVGNEDLNHLSGVDSGLWGGLSACMRLEHPSIRLINLAVDEPGNKEILKGISGSFKALYPMLAASKNGPRGQEETGFAIKGGQLFVSRVTPRQGPSEYIRRSEKQANPEPTSFLDSSRPLKGELGTHGLLETLRWTDDTEPLSVGPDDIKLELRAASINFKDVLTALGQLEGLTEMQNDCSGVVVQVGANMTTRFKPGDRVCSLYSRSYSNYPVVHGECCHLIPDSMTFEQAASLPIVWTTVYHCLVEKGQLSRGEKVLIHSGAGAVGQAAIMLAQYLGAEVFTTVSTSKKAELLHQLYGIPRERILSNRDTNFYSEIKRQTGGYGVDVVLNYLSGEVFRQSCNLVAPFGRFFEIGRKDLQDDALMPMEFLLKNITFSCVNLALVIETNKKMAGRLLREVMKLMASGVVRPVMLTTMPISDIETAFRQIQAGQHVGKIILTVEQNQQVKAIPSVPSQAELYPDATYVIIGGLGGIGKAIIQWMGQHGAKNIVCLSRSGAKLEQDRAFIAKLAAEGLNVIGSKCDITRKHEVASVVQGIHERGLPQIRGVIQCAMVLQDTMLKDMTIDDWNAAIKPKVDGTKNLHACMGRDLDFFINLSSVVAISGNIGQANYAAACGIQDAIARHRAAMGLPGYSINVGLILEVGFISENPELAAALQRHFGTVSISELLALLGYVIKNAKPGDLSDCSCSIGLGRQGPASADRFMADRRFSHLTLREKSEEREESTDIVRLLDNVTELSDAIKVICASILQQLGKLIVAPEESLDASQSLNSYGVDSLVAVELRNWIASKLQADIQLLVLRGSGSIHQLAEAVAKESRLVEVGTS